MNATRNISDAGVNAPALAGRAGEASRGGHATRLALAVVLIAVCCAWAFFPLDPAQVETPQIAATEALSPATTRAALDLSAFNAPLWVTPSPPPTVIAAPAPPPPPPPPPLRWQLLAIVREGSGYKALVYDPETDKVLSLAEGDESGPRRIARIASASMDVQDPSGVRTLALRDPAGGGQP